MAERLLSTGQAAKAIGVSPRSLSHWVTRGLIKPTLVTPGGQYRFDLDELKAQMQKRQAPARGPRPAEEDDE
ncbi:MAG TPA: helix-turn-helix domain-containing protein [Pseudonocardia sp.]|nr:helix-turn-helix domain-containing protein [Pseudonocardia sp.]